MATIHDAEKLYGLIGYPLEHSFSIDYFNSKFEAEGISARYINFEIEDIGQLMEIISEYPRLNGLNVTAPYKEQVIAYMDEMDESAASVGAVNVIKFMRGEGDQDLRLKGYNTDVTGFSMTVEALRNPANVRSLVLGTGGASKAVTVALEKLGIPVTHVSRHKSASTTTYEELTRQMVHDHLLVVNATPVGMFPHVDQTPDFPFRFLTPDHLAYDLIYNPNETKFMRLAREHGAKVKNGLEMLLLQAFQSYEIWNQ